MADSDDDRELFENAMRDLKRDDLFKGKFGFDDDEPTPVAIDEEAVAIVAETRELRTMEDAFFDVDRIEDRKYRRKPGREIEPTTGPVSAKPVPVVPEIQIETPVNDWEQLAAKTHDAKVLDLRAVTESNAFRELAIEFPRAAAARIVFQAETDDHMMKGALEKWANGLGRRFLFSPDTDERSGLLIIESSRGES